MKGGAALVPAVESAARAHDVPMEEFATDLGGWFAAWARDGIIVDILV